MNIPEVNTPYAVPGNNTAVRTDKNGGSSRNASPAVQVSEPDSYNAPQNREPTLQNPAASRVNVQKPIIKRQAAATQNVVQAAYAEVTVPTGPRNENPNAQPVTENPTSAPEQIKPPNDTVELNPNAGPEGIASPDQDLQAQRLKRQITDLQTANAGDKSSILNLLA